MQNPFFFFFFFLPTTNTLQLSTGIWSRIGSVLAAFLGGVLSISCFLLFSMGRNTFMASFCSNTLPKMYYNCGYSSYLDKNGQFQKICDILLFDSPGNKNRILLDGSLTGEHTINYY